MVLIEFPSVERDGNYQPDLSGVWWDKNTNATSALEANANGCCPMKWNASVYKFILIMV